MALTTLVKITASPVVEFPSVIPKLATNSATSVAVFARSRAFWQVAVKLVPQLAARELASVAAFVAASAAASIFVRMAVSVVKVAAKFARVAAANAWLAAVVRDVAGGGVEREITTSRPSALVV